jgi:membrane associated rhomboid family serine protease
VARLRISYNAPVVLTFAILAVIVQLLPDATQTKWFQSHGTLKNGLSDYVGLFSHILGHQDWNHLLANFMLILLLGPILEERYKSLTLLVMILITALLSGLVDVIIGSGTHGASGIAFMMILLASTANIRHGEIPLTFIAVGIIYIGGEIVRAFDNDNISQLGHILGGLSGAAFGFLGAKAKGLDTSIKPTATKQILPTATTGPPKKPAL